MKAHEIVVGQYVVDYKETRYIVLCDPYPQNTPNYKIYVKLRGSNDNVISLPISEIKPIDNIIRWYKNGKFIKE